MDIIGEKPPDTESKPDIICNAELEIQNSILQSNETIESTGSNIEEIKNELKEESGNIQNILSDNDMEIDFECSKSELVQHNEEKTEENNIEVLIEDSQPSNGKMEVTDLNDVIEIESDQKDSSNKSEIDSQSKLEDSNENEYQIDQIDDKDNSILTVENENDIVNIDENASNTVNIDENMSTIVNIDENESKIISIDENESHIVETIEENDNNVENIEEKDNSIVNIEDDSSSPDDVQIINNEDITNQLKSQTIDNSISVKQKIDSQNLVDSIASEWNMSDGEGDTDFPPKSAPSPEPSSSPKTNEKSSAEIIAMEWDDGSAPNENINTENKIVEEIVQDEEKKPDIHEENNHHSCGGDGDSTTNSIICTVIENTEENTEKNDNQENIIILHDLSGLNLNNQNSGITIISVDENPDMNSTSNATNENSYVIHELNIEPPPSNLTQSTTKNDTNIPTPTTKIIEKRRSNRSSKYPYVVCSKEDLCKEIEQSTRKSTDIPPGGDVLFKNQIIKRLASKILPKSLNNSPTVLNNVDIKPPVLDKPTTPSNVTTDQELLDILEGDADIDVYNLQKAKETHLAGDDSKILKSDEILSTSSSTSTTPRAKPKKLDPDLEREIALQQLSEMPDLPTTTKRKGKNNNVVLTNVPSTKIIEKTEVEGGDPFKFVENTKTVGTPNKYGATVASVKTYSRKGTPLIEPSLKDIVIPKELEQHIDFNKQLSPKRRKYNRKSTSETLIQGKSSNKNVKKIESARKKNIKKTEKNENDDEDDDVKGDKSDKADKKTDNKIFLTDDTSNVLISKRSRIIKRKIIWDPSLKAPTYVIPSVAKGKVQKPKNTKHLIPKKKLKSIGNEIVKENDEIVKNDSEKKDTITENNVTSNETNDKIEDIKEENEKETVENSSPNAVNVTPNKRKVDESVTSSSSSGGTPQARKKKFKYMSEIDKLLMDEGAINMIYSVEQDEKTPLVRRQQRVISLDKFDKEIAKKKKMILSALNTSPEQAPKALRKKDSNATPPVRKKSRDSIRSSIQSPPPSPNSMFPPRAEASRIIRRHSSSSSFSSECMSPRRLSAVDAPILSGGNEKIKKTTTSEDNFKITTQKQAKKENSTIAAATSSTKKMRIMKIVQPRILRRRGGVPIFIKKSKTNIYPTGTKSKYLLKKIENKVDGKTDETEESEQKQEKNSTETENSVVLRSAVQQPKSSKKETPIKSSSPTPESYQNIVKNLDSNEISKKKDGTGGDVEKQRTSSRQNAGTYNYKEISVRKYDELVQIIFTPQSSTKMKNSLNIQTMREFCDALITLKKDSSCKVLLITSTGSVFCRGLDYTPLIQQNMEKRKTIAQETANAVKEFVRAIVQFPRPVIAGVQGAASGLGVAILPLCDLVFVSDKATFSMNQCKLGCLPEGAASVSLPHVTSHAVAAELLIAGHTLTAMEALRHGLASRVLWPEGYFQELIPLCKAIASQSSQSMDTTKLLIRHSLSLKLEAALDSESHILVQHWVSSECQQLLKKFVEQQD